MRNNELLYKTMTNYNLIFYHATSKLRKLGLDELINLKTNKNILPWSSFLCKTIEMMNMNSYIKQRLITTLFFLSCYFKVEYKPSVGKTKNQISSLMTSFWVEKTWKWIVINWWKGYQTNWPKNKVNHLFHVFFIF